MSAFSLEAIMKTARGFHHAAAELEAINRQKIRPGQVGIDLAYLEQLMGRSASAVVLEALAVELVLKARLKRAGISFAKLPDKHDHSALYALMPDLERQEADQRYQASQYRAMRATLAEALGFSALVFKEWRYMHEYSSVQASMDEMQRAFRALAHGM